MSFYTKLRNGKEYPYFRAGAEDEFALGPKDNPNIRNINKALEYISKKNDHYFEIEKKLFDMLPEPERKEYLSKRAAELLAWVRRLEELQKMKQTQLSLGVSDSKIIASQSIKKSTFLKKSRSVNAPPIKKTLKKHKKGSKKKKKKHEKK